MVCVGTTGGNGKSWYADNFRIYYIKSDVISAYRDRLQARLDEAALLHEKMVEAGIDDSDDLGFALDPEDGYPDFIESGTQEELQLAIEDMDRMLEEGNTIITNYETLTPLLSNGTVWTVN